MPKNPVKPGSHKHPTGQHLNQSLAIKLNRDKWQAMAYKINELIDAFPYTKKQVDKSEAPTVRKQDKRTRMLTNMEYKSYWFAANSGFDVGPKTLKRECELFLNATMYEYELSATQMDATMRTIENILTDDLLNGSNYWTNRFWLNTYIDKSVVDGTTDSFNSAVNITQGTTAEAKLAILQARDRLVTPAYYDRLQLVHGRVFEEMRGLTAEMKSQLRLTLTVAVARGVGIRVLKGMINRRLSVGMVRAERIARTEINHAYRTAYMKESDDLNKDVIAGTQWKIMQCHRSALAPTTRPHHAARHGTLHTSQEQREWWSIDGNSINCLCSTLDVLVDRKTGEVLQQKMIDTMLKQKKQWFPTK